MPIFGRFNERAQRVIAAAQKAAVDLGHAYVGSEHFLIGLLREARSDAPALPDNVIPETVIENVKQITGTGGHTPSQLELTPRVKKLLENSVREAQRLGHPYVTAGHFWLALLVDEESVAMRVLTGMGCDIEKLRKSVQDALGSAGEGPAGAASSGNESCLQKYGRNLNEAAEKGDWIDLAQINSVDTGLVEKALAAGADKVYQ